MTDVVLLELIGGHPGRFFGVDVVHGAGHVGLPLYRIEHEEFRLRAEQGAVGDTGGLQVFLGAQRHGARITLVTLHGSRLNDVATQVQRGHVGERVENGGFVFGQQNHVGFVDAFPTGDGGTIEHLAVLEEVVVDLADGKGHVLLFTMAVGKTQIHPLHVVIFNQFQRLFRHC